MTKVISTTEEQTMTVTLEACPSPGNSEPYPVTVTFRFKDDIKATQVDIPQGSIPLDALQQAIGTFLEAHPEFAA